MTVAILSGGSQVAVLLLIGCFGAASVTAAVMGQPVVIIALLVVASAIQRAVAASTLSATALWLDDIVLVGMVLYAAGRIMKESSLRVKLVVVVLVLVLGVAVVRAPDLGLGITQFRQMAVPMILVLFGMVLTREQIMKAGPIVVAVIFVGAVYGLFEQLGWRPIDPLGVLGLNQYAHGKSFEGLPNSYYYYPADGVRLERSGGLVLNPPSFGMLVGAGLIWAWYTLKGHDVAKLICTVVFLAAALFAFGRGGFVLIALAAFQPLLTRKSGKLSFLVVGVVLGYVALSEFISDGQSAKHVDGFVGGIVYAITHPLGGGFGTAGNSLSRIGLENESGANESLAAIFMASVGWIGIAVIAFLLVRGILAGRSLPGAALTGAVVVSLVSETAGGLDATGPLWILAGFALSPLSRDASFPPTRAERRLIRQSSAPQADQIGATT
ncbi:hypothetical protein [Herbiconiux sp. A18JL235]|uniref:O-antigen ligase domain-containing protein n=1 Tax=Herbiconiux sp. A18JL235 TaxID=3152363 RepID=A0AB39BK04_9MICO